MHCNSSKFHCKFHCKKKYYFMMLFMVVGIMEYYPRFISFFGVALGAFPFIKIAIRVDTPTYSRNGFVFALASGRNNSLIASFRFSFNFSIVFSRVSIHFTFSQVSVYFMFSQVSFRFYIYFSFYS